MDASHDDPFPETLWSVVLSAADPEVGDASEALGILAERYREPAVGWFERQRIPRSDAEDLTQQFLIRLLSGGVLRGFQQKSTRFRVFLTTCLRNHLRDHLRRADALKRGGEVEMVPWDEALPDPVGGMEALESMDVAFARTAAQRAMDSVESKWAAKGWTDRFSELRPHLYGGQEAGICQVIGERLGLKGNNVRQLLFLLREDFFSAFRREVAATVAPDQLNEELRYLVGCLGHLDAD